MDSSNDNQHPFYRAMLAVVNGPKFDPNRNYSLEEVLGASLGKPAAVTSEGTAIYNLENSQPKA